MGAWKREKGVMIILFAVLLPFFFLCAGFAVDLGRLFVRESQLQNAADASVIAAAYVYPEKNSMMTDAYKYMHANLDSTHMNMKDDESWKVDDIVVRNPLPGKNADGVLLTLFASEKVDTLFMGMVGIHQMPVAVKSTCKLVPQSNDGPGVFGYTFLGTDTTKHALELTSGGVRIHGKVHSDGSIQLPYITTDAKSNWVTLDFGSFSTSVPTDMELWSGKRSANYWEHEGLVYDPIDNTEKVDPAQKAIHQNDIPASVDPNDPTKDTWWYMYRFRYDNGTADGEDVVASRSQSGKINTSLSPDNPMTQAIYQFIQETAEAKAKAPPEEHSWDQPKDGIFYNLNSGFNDWRKYTIIIANGDVSLSDNNILDRTKPMYVISLNGGINFNVSDGGSGTTFKALAYAPNGIITYNGPNFEGSLVGKSIVVNTKCTFTGNSFGFGGNSGGSSGGNTPGGKLVVSLHADKDGDYEPAN